jgi:hypothetical protein
MTILGKLFGTDEAIKKGVDVVASGFDALIYTDEEKASDQAQSITEARSMLIQWVQSSQGQRLARRIIALSITAVWLFLYLCAGFLSIAAIWAENPKELHASAQIVGAYSDGMNGAVMLILAFYFAAPHIGSIIEPAMEKFGKRTPTRLPE